MSIIKKPTQKSAIETASLIGGGVGGAMLSRGAFAAIHDDATNPKTGVNYTKIGKRVVAIAIGAGLAMFVKADDVMSSGVKGVGAGVAIAQSLDLITDLSATNPKMNALATSSKKTDKFLAKSLGLACPSDPQFALGRPRAKRRGMNGADMEIPAVLTENSYGSPVKSLDAVFQSKRAV